MSIVTAVLFLLMFQPAEAQRYATKNGSVKLTYKAPHGLMSAENHTVAMSINTITGEIYFSVVMLSFRFSGPLAQQQFDDYFKKNVHFATSVFKGKVVGIEAIDLTKPGKHKVEIAGEFTFRRTTKHVKAKAELAVANDKITGKSSFTLNLRDYNINLPPTMESEIKISADGSLLKIK